MAKNLIDSIEKISKKGFFPTLGITILLSLVSLYYPLSSTVENWQKEILWQKIQSLNEDRQNQEALRLLNQNAKLQNQITSEQSLLLGKIYWQGKDWSKAYYYLGKAQKGEALPEAQYLFFLLSLSLNPQKIEPPIGAIPEYLQDETAKFSATINQLSKSLLAARILLLAKEPNLAKNLLTKISAQSPDYPLVALYEGIAENELGNTLMAQKYWWQAIKLDPNNKDLIATIINLNHQTDDFSRVLGERIETLEKTKQ